MRPRTTRRAIMPSWSLGLECCDLTLHQGNPLPIFFLGGDLITSLVRSGPSSIVASWVTETNHEHAREIGVLIHIHGEDTGPSLQDRCRPRIS